MERDKSAVDNLLPNNPLMKEMKKPPIKYIKHTDYGVRKLWKRIKDSNDKTPHR